MKMNQWALLLAGIFAVHAATANAQTVELNMGGSSAGTGFASSAPPKLFLPYDATTNPIRHYVNGDIVGPPAVAGGRLHVWTGLLNGAQVTGLGGRNAIIRYAATGSSDGIIRLQNNGAIVQITDPASNLTYLNHALLTGCTGPALVDADSNGTTDYEEFTGCQATVSLPVLLGASDVHGSSFHQTGPVTTQVQPLAQELLTSTQAAVVPFKLVLGNGVKKNVGGVLQPVETLSHSQVEGLLSRQVTDWRTFGFAPDIDNNGADDGGAAPVTLCIRRAGSGTKATLDETVMIVAGEITAGSTNLNNAAAGVYFGGSTQDIQDCIGGSGTPLNRPAHPLALGYMDADAPTPGGYNVKLDGLLPRDATLADPKANLKNGLYYFWAGWRLNSRPSGSPGISADQETLLNAFVSKVQEPAVVNGLKPTAGDYWVAPSEMCVFKNSDRGPISWKSPLPAGCPR